MGAACCDSSKHGEPEGKTVLALHRPVLSPQCAQTQEDPKRAAAFGPQTGKDTRTGNGPGDTEDCGSAPKVPAIDCMPNVVSAGTSVQCARKTLANAEPDGDLSIGRFQLSGDMPPTNRSTSSQRRSPTAQVTKESVKMWAEDMVKGRAMEVVRANGKKATCFCTLSNKFDALTIRVADQERRIQLVDVEKIAVGSEASGPVDELCVSLKQNQGDYISFRLRDRDSRDTFVKSVHLFREKQKAKRGQSSKSSICAAKMDNSTLSKTLVDTAKRDDGSLSKLSIEKDKADDCAPTDPSH